MELWLDSCDSSGAQCLLGSLEGSHSCVIDSSQKPGARGAGGIGKGCMAWHSWLEPCQEGRLLRQGGMAVLGSVHPWLCPSLALLCLSVLWLSQAPNARFHLALSSDMSGSLERLEISVILGNDWFHNTTVTRPLSRQSGDRVMGAALSSCSQGSFSSAFSGIKVSSPYQEYKGSCLVINSCK